MSNSITAFFKGRTGVAESVYQYDYGKVLIIDGLSLPATFEVHFTTVSEDDAITVIGQNSRVAIPDSCINKPGTVTAYIYLHTGENDGETEYVIKFAVIRRARPDYDEDDKSNWESAASQALAMLQNSKKVNTPLDEYNQVDNGTAGQLLRTKGDGSTEWVDEGLPTDEQTANAVSAWLDEHPEATTTVVDGSLTEAKFSNELKLKAIKDYVTPEMFGAKGDGETDDTVALRKMFVAACSGYAVVFPQSKTYIINPIDTAAIFPITKGITIYGNGSTLKVADGATGYDAILGCSEPSDDLTGLHIEGLVFNHNSENGADYTKSGNVLNNARMTIGAQVCNDFVFKNNVVMKSACTNNIYINGATDTNNILIDGNTFKLMGKSPNGIYFDHSTIYAHGDNIVITNNSFESEDWGTEGTTTAIEVHPGNGCIIANNIIKKYFTAINYAGVHTRDSVNGLIDANIIDVLRHGIMLYGSTFGTHTTGYAINGLTISNNIIRIRNAISTGNIPLEYGVNGISFTAFSLPAKDVFVTNCQIVFDENATTLNSFNYGAIGIFDDGGSATYENIIYENIIIINPPSFSAALGRGGGIIKNCELRGLRIYNPCCAAEINEISYGLRQGINMGAKQYVGRILVDAMFYDADVILCRRPFVVGTVDDSTSADIRIRGSIIWSNAPTTGYYDTTYNAVTKTNNNVTPLINIDVNEGLINTRGDFAPSYTSAVLKAGSMTSRKDTGVVWYNDTDGSTVTELVASSTAEKVLINSLQRV